MAKSKITNMQEMRMLGMRHALQKGETVTADCIRMLMNKDQIANNLTDAKFGEEMQYLAALEALEASYYSKVCDAMSDQYDFSSSLKKDLKKVSRYGGQIMFPEKYTNDYMFLRHAFDDISGKMFLDNFLDQNNSIFGLGFGSVESDDAWDNIVKNYTPQKDFKSAKLDLCAAVSGGDLNLDNYDEELKDSKYDKWANETFNNMFRPMYSLSMAEIREKQGFDPMKLLSINGQPMEDVVRESPLYDPNKSFEEQAARCAIHKLLGGNASLEVRQYDKRSNTVSDAVKAEVKPEITEKSSIKRWFRRLFSFITGEKSFNQRKAEIGKSDAEVDNSPEAKQDYSRSARGEQRAAERAGERTSFREETMANEQTRNMPTAERSAQNSMEARNDVSMSNGR